MFSLQILLRLQEKKKITRPYGKGQTKGIDFSPKLVVVDGFKIALSLEKQVWEKESKIIRPV